MSGDFEPHVRDAVDPDTRIPLGVRGRAGSPRRAGHAPSPRIRSSRSKSAGWSNADEMDEARERFGGLVALHQRRPSRIAYQYLRDAAEADEAVQDAFVKVFTHITVVSRSVAVRGLVHAHSHQWLPGSPQGAGPPRSLVRRRLKPSGADEARAVGDAAGARSRASAPRARAPGEDRGGGRSARRPAAHRVHVVSLRRLHAAGSQRMTGLNESTVRVHLFRAARRLRALLGGKP